jgi:hypothetical protein
MLSKQRYKLYFVKKLTKRSHFITIKVPTKQLCLANNKITAKRSVKLISFKFGTVAISD